jgi:hypothetical protein
MSDSPEKVYSVHLAKAYIALKPTVNDPQELIIKGGVPNLFFCQINPDT